MVGRSPGALPRGARADEEEIGAAVSAVIASVAKQSSFLRRGNKAGLLRRGACHRARIRATRWLLAMTLVANSPAGLSPPSTDRADFAAESFPTDFSAAPP